MFRCHAITAFGVFAVIGCAIVILSVSPSSTPAQGTGLKTQMQQEITQALQESIGLHEQALLEARAKEDIGLITSIEVGEVQLKLSEARLQLAVAQNQPNIAIREFRKCKAIHEEQLEWIMSMVAQEVAADSDVAESKLKLLQQRIRLATTIRDMQ
jgi:hypothetical protein